jgi:hypothetical protein
MQNNSSKGFNPDCAPDHLPRRWWGWVALYHAGLTVAGCGGGEAAIATDLPAGDTAVCVALGADYRNNVGTLAAVGLPSLTVLQDMAPNAISGDPVLRVHGRRLHVVNRSANNITIIDPTVSPWAVETQFSTGDNSNPQDIALAGTRAYVTLYNKPEVQVWDLGGGTPAAPAATVDLSAYDEDGVPNANSVVVHGGHAYVTLDLLDTQTFPQPRGVGKVAVIDTGDNRVIAALDLRYSNPYDFMYPRGDRLIVATFTDFSGTTGCLEQIVPGSAPRVESCLVENRDVMGVINSIAVGPAETYLAVSAFDAEFNQTAQIRRVDVADTLMPEPMTPAGQIPTDVAYAPSGHLVYSDVAAGGLRVIELATGREITTAALDIGLTPATANAIACLTR